MTLRIGINGFGRIGRNVLRALVENPVPEIEITRINDLCDPTTAAHLLRYDSVHGRFDANLAVEGDTLFVNGAHIAFTKERDPEKLQWHDYGVDVVLECTGRFSARDGAAKHLAAGAKRVLISGPSPDADHTVVFGVNHTALTPSHRIVSNASCTTNCLAPIAHVLHREIGIESGYMTTIHAYTADQSLVDSPHKDLRRARAAAMSVIPTSTGAARALKLVIPDLSGIVDGSAIRVPVANVSMIDLVVYAKRETTIEEINSAFDRAVAGPLGAVLGINRLPLVSVDFLHNRYSSVFDATQTSVTKGRTVRVVGWYDNEWGFANRMLDVARLLGS
jgi:glyceraldehyde 3-phosphate dehydrogenase